MEQASQRLIQDIAGEWGYHIDENPDIWSLYGFCFRYSRASDKDRGGYLLNDSLVVQFAKAQLAKIV